MVQVGISLVARKLKFYFFIIDRSVYRNVTVDSVRDNLKLLNMEKKEEKRTNKLLRMINQAIIKIYALFNLLSK